MSVQHIILIVHMPITLLDVSEGKSHHNFAVITI